MYHILQKYEQRSCSNAAFPLGLDLWFDLAGETKGADPIRTAVMDQMRSPNEKQKEFPDPFATMAFWCIVFLLNKQK